MIAKKYKALWIILVVFIGLALGLHWLNNARRAHYDELSRCENLSFCLQKFASAHSRMPADWQELERLGYGKIETGKDGRLFVIDETIGTFTCSRQIPVDLFVLQWGVGPKELHANGALADNLIAKNGESVLDKNFYEVNSRQIRDAMTKRPATQPGGPATSSAPSE